MQHAKAAFVDQAWNAVTLVCVLAAVGIPLRTVWLSRGINGGVVLSVAVALVQITAFVYRKRLPKAVYTLMPAATVLLASVVATLTLGLQGNGITYFIVGNTLVAMLCPPQVVKRVFLVTIVVLLVAAVGFVSGRIPVRFAADHATNGVVWAYAILTVIALSYSILTGITYHRDSMHRLTEQVLAQREEIARLAHTDALTGLPSLRLATDRLDVACRQAERSQGKVAVLFVDLDGFKAVNDTRGHASGDDVLKQTALRMEAAIRTTDTAARIGGDEFMVILNDVESLQAAEAVAQKLVQAVSAPIVLGTGAEASTVCIGASVGLALCPDHAASATKLLSLADRAMYRVKKSTKNSYAVVGLQDAAAHPAPAAQG